ncbi:hypothetical protein CHUAL_011904 [Chamberlinius hualienensis]
MPYFLNSVFTSLLSAKIIKKSAKTSPMQLAPSDIHYLAGYNQQCYKPDQNLLNSLTSRLTGQSIFKLMSDNCNKNNNVTQHCKSDNNNVSVHTFLPKIQVAERNGAWFSLNSSYLHVFRELERLGKCVLIEVEVVPLSKVPKFIQDSMVVQLPNKPNLINWDQDEVNNDTGAEDENKPLLVHSQRSTTTKGGKLTNNEFQNLKDDLKKIQNGNEATKTFCWPSSNGGKTKFIDGEAHEQEMYDLEPVLFAHEGEFDLLII